MKLSDLEGVKTNAKNILESPQKTFPAIFQGIENGRYKFTDKKGNPHYLVPMMVGDFKNHLEPGMKAKLTYAQVSPNYADYKVSSVIYEDINVGDYVNPKWDATHATPMQVVDRHIEKHARRMDIPVNDVVVKDEFGNTAVMKVSDLVKVDAQGAGMMEGFTDSELQGIFDRHEDDYMRFRQTGELDGPFFDELYSYFADRGEMPYEVMKARTVDPTEWIADRISQNDVDEPIKHEGVTTEAPSLDIVGRVWGTDKAVSLKDKWDKLTSMDWLFGDTGHDRDYPRFNANYTKERLKRSGFNDDEINQIRDMVTQAMKAAVLWGQRRFGIDDREIRTSPESFAVYQLSMQVRPEQSIQINKMARNLLARKLEKGGFNEEAKGAPNPQGAQGAQGSDENSDNDERFARNLERVLGKQLDKAQPAEIKTAKQKLDAMRTEGKNMKDKKALREDTSINNMTINMDVQAHGPEDSLELLRKLSGLPVQAPVAAPMPGAPVPGAGIPGAEPVAPAAPDMGMDAGDPQDFVDLSPFDSMPDDSDMDSDLDDPAVQDMGADMMPPADDVNVEPDMDADMDAGMEPAMDMGMEPQEAVDEGEADRMFNNSPREKTFGADAQIKQGTDLNRPKQQFKKEYPGDNPMAEAKALSETLYKKYVMKVVEGLTETPVTDEEDRRARCQELGRYKQDAKAMQDPATRAAVLKKWEELRCGG